MPDKFDNEPGIKNSRSENNNNDKDNLNDNKSNSSKKDFKQNHNHSYEEDINYNTDYSSSDYYDDNFYEEEINREYKKKPTVKEGYTFLKSQGKIAAYYIGMVVALILVNALAGFGIIPKLLQYLIMIGIIVFILYKFRGQHLNDEDTLD